MMALLREWILGILGAALLSGVVIALSPKGKWAGVMTLICGFMLITVLVSPVMRLDIESISRAIVDYKASVGSYGEALETENQRLMAGIIEKEAAEYILDKAAELGIQLEEVTVVTRLENGEYPYPYAAELTGSATEEEKALLAEAIQAELGIAKERQTWN